MKNLKITLSITALFIASHAVHATEVQEQNAPTNEEALYQLELQPIDQHRSEQIGILCRPFPGCIDNIAGYDQLLEAQPTLTPKQ